MLLCIKEFGFDHIIIIGEHENGLLFLDCYGRVFDWDYMIVQLRPLGKNLDECDITRLSQCYNYFYHQLFNIRDFVQFTTKLIYANETLYYITKFNTSTE